MNEMLDRIKSHNNEFWEDARKYYLEDFLGGVYRSRWKRRMLKRWLHGAGVRRVVFRQTDFCCDPLVVEFLPDDFAIRVGEGAAAAGPDVEVELTHMAIVPSSSFLKSFLSAWFWGEASVMRFWSRLRDNAYAAAIFLI